MTSGDVGSPPDGGCPPFEVIGLIKVTVILFQSGWYFRDHRVAPTEAVRRLRALDHQLLP